MKRAPLLALALLLFAAPLSAQVEISNAGGVTVSGTCTTATTANAGDSATAFFSVGTIEAARLPAATGLSSACTDVQVLGGNAAGTGVECQADDDAPEAGDYSALTAGRSLTAPSAGTVDADAELYTDVKCVNIDPGATTTDWFMFRAPVAMTVTGVDCIVDAATSVVLTVRECDANGGSCSDIEAAITCAATNTTEASTVDNASLDAGDWIRVTRGTVTGSPTQAVLCLELTLND